MTVNLFSKPRRRGITFIELLISVSILSFVMIATMYFFVSILRQERSNIRTLQMAYQTANLHRELRKVSAYGGNIDITNGRAVQFTNEVTGVTSELRFVDDDGDPFTIGDNTIEFDPDITIEDDDEILISLVSPLTDEDGNILPIFARADGFPDPLLVEFRMGDTSGPVSRGNRSKIAQARQDDAFTGPGLQTNVYRGAFALRRTMQ